MRWDRNKQFVCMLSNKNGVKWIKLGKQDTMEQDAMENRTLNYQWNRKKIELALHKLKIRQYGQSRSWNSLNWTIWIPILDYKKEFSTFTLFLILCKKYLPITQS